MIRRVCLETKRQRHRKHRQQQRSSDLTLSGDCVVKARPAPRREERKVRRPERLAYATHGCFRALYLMLVSGWRKPTTVGGMVQHTVYTRIVVSVCLHAVSAESACTCVLLNRYRHCQHSTNTSLACVLQWRACERHTKPLHHNHATEAALCVLLTCFCPWRCIWRRYM